VSFSTSPRGAAPSTSAVACLRCITSSRSWPASTSRPFPWSRPPTCHYPWGHPGRRRYRGDHGPRALRRGRGERGDARGQPARRQLAVGPSCLRPPGRDGAADFAEARSGNPVVSDTEVGGRINEATEPLGRQGGESPYDIQHDLQETMQNLVGIIRTESELTSALAELDKLDERCDMLSVSGPQTYNPGWNLATDLPAMLTVSRLVAKGSHRPPGEPGRPHPRRLSEARRGVRDGQPRAAHPSRRAVHARQGTHSPDARRAPHPVRGGHALMADVTMTVWRGDPSGGAFADYVMPSVEGEVVLDVLHRIQAGPAPTWPAGGTARPGSAVRARRRSTACPPDVHDAHGRSPGGRARCGHPHAHLPHHP